MCSVVVCSSVFVSQVQCVATGPQRRAAKFSRRHEARRAREQWHREAAEKSRFGWQGQQRARVEYICRSVQEKEER